MMRAMAYVVASLAAVGLVIALATTPGEPVASSPETASPGPASSAQRVMEQPGTLTLHVPEMHCPFACYPAVKETLESDAGVSEVELTQQKQEGAIDNPQVIVRYDKGFNVDAAIESLAQKGFADSALVQ